MTPFKTALRATAPIALGVAALTGLMLVIYALAGFFRLPVLWGAIAGTVLALGNFFLMALSAGAAADKAGSQDVKGGTAPCLAHSVEHDDVGMLCQFMTERTLRREVAICLVDDDYAVEAVDDFVYLVAVEGIARGVVGRA